MMVAKDEKLACRTEMIFVDLWGTDATTCDCVIGMNVYGVVVRALFVQVQ